MDKDALQAVAQAFETEMLPRLRDGVQLLLECGAASDAALVCQGIDGIILGLQKQRQGARLWGRGDPPSD